MSIGSPLWYLLVLAAGLIVGMGIAWFRRKK